MPSPEEKAVWALMELGRSHTIDEIAMIAEVDVRQCSDAVQKLLRGGYVAMEGLRKAASGEALPLFRQIRSSFEPPFGRIEFKAAGNSYVDLPTLKGLMRAVASQFDHPFSRKEIMDKMDGMAAPAQLKKRLHQYKGEILQASRSRALCLQRTGDSRADNGFRPKKHQSAVYRHRCVVQVGSQSRPNSNSPNTGSAGCSGRSEGGSEMHWRKAGLYSSAQYRGVERMTGKSTVGDMRDDESKRLVN